MSRILFLIKVGILDFGTYIGQVFIITESTTAYLVQLEFIYQNFLGLNIYNFILNLLIITI